MNIPVLPHQTFLELSQQKYIFYSRSGYEMIAQGDYSALAKDYGTTIILSAIVVFLLSRFFRYSVDVYYTNLEKENYQKKIMTELPGIYKV
jgi:hypothetical protein